jgi:hypothetical protein
MVSRAVLALCIAGCGARPHPAPATATDEAITLYRDRALVRQRVESWAAAGTTIAIRSPPASPERPRILDRGSSLWALRSRRTDAPRSRCATPGRRMPRARRANPRASRGPDRAPGPAPAPRAVSCAD